MIENYSHRKLEKATEEHKDNSPLARLYSHDTTGEREQTQITPFQQTNTDTVIKLAEELGVAKERVKQLEKGSGNKTYDSSKDFLAQFLNGPEELGGWEGMIIAKAKFTMHAVLHNFAVNLLHIVDKLAPDRSFLKFNSEGDLTP